MFLRINTPLYNRSLQKRFLKHQQNVWEASSLETFRPCKLMLKHTTANIRFVSRQTYIVSQAITHQPPDSKLLMFPFFH